ncbi:hypothetical protein U5801_21485 [Lamprobacter modestohalophilus]|uniref:hypothetical protein n=1 Tax=Lamprobacter modestohalophilus TaxID=1064514 RepID=UPI002ADECF56|nr:hypothetical protein [Lamprobacter modestohalophilus]MEA1052358.1 hypothetical protein [Lamprobacter modestohalophilus]
MIKHPRTLIREAVAMRLSAQLPEVDARITASRISIHRAIPLFAAKLPAILIYTRDERVEDLPHNDPGLRHRLLDLAIEIVTTGKEADEEADALALGIEAILDADETLGLLVEGLRLTRTETDQDGDGDAVYLAVRLLWEVSYWTRPAEPDELPMPWQVFAGHVPLIGAGFGAHYEQVADEPTEEAP